MSDSDKGTKKEASLIGLHTGCLQHSQVSAILLSRAYTSPSPLTHNITKSKATHTTVHLRSI